MGNLAIDRAGIAWSVLRVSLIQMNRFPLQMGDIPTDKSRLAMLPTKIPWLRPTIALGPDALQIARWRA